MPIRKLVRIMVVSLLLTVVLAAFLPQTAMAQTCGVSHTVVRGQNLFRISLRYGVSIEAIAAANGIADVRRIYAGQVLFIPCASGTAGLTTTTDVTVTTSVSPTTVTTGVGVVTTTTIGAGAAGAAGAQLVDCTGFRATSPLDGFNDGPTTFYWDPPRSGGNVIIYQVVVLDDRGARVISFDTASGITRVTGNVGWLAIGGRSRFSWFVIAIANGVEVCRTATAPVQRAWNDNAGLSPQP